MTRHFMNPSMGKHFGSEEGDDTSEGEGKKKVGAKGLPDIHIKSHDKGHTVHILPHKDSGMAPEQHEHELGDADGIVEHIRKHLGKVGQDHGDKGGEGSGTEELGDGMGLSL